jgi:hypothetical protein
MFRVNYSVARFYTEDKFMLKTIPVVVAALIAVAVLVMGCFYLVAPERVTGSFGLKLPAADADTRAWLHLKGIRDVGCGLAVLVLMLTADRRSLGIVVLALAVIPFGDMAIVLATGGSRVKAFSIHGLTCAVMVVVGLLLIRVL